MMKVMSNRVVQGLLGLAVLLIGCGGTVSFLNPTFLNSIQGGVFPVTPGPNAGFVLVRVRNETQEVAEFVVTIERTVKVLDDDGNAQRDENGDLVTRDEMETVRLRTFPENLANDAGVLFDCRDSPVIRLGLGENLLAGEPAAFIYEDYNRETGVSGGGYGVSAEGLNPLAVPNFVCGDTVIYRMFESTGTGTSGNVKFQALLQPGSEQPFEFTGPSTFLNYEQFLQTQVREDEP